MFVFVLFFSLALASSRANLKVAQQAWEAVSDLDYSYEWASGPCHCLQEAFLTKVVTVRGGQVVSVVVKDTGVSFDYSPGTAEEIFGQIATTLLEDKKVTATYDPVIGFPVGDLVLDVDALAYDGGISWIFSNFQFTSACSEIPSCEVCAAFDCKWQVEQGCAETCALQDTGCWGGDVECPGIACTMEAKVCADGSSVGRDGTRDCAFELCPEEVFSFIDENHAEIETYLNLYSEFSGVEIVEVLDDSDIVIRVVSESDTIDDYVEDFKNNFADAVGVRHSRVSVKNYLPEDDAVKKRVQSTWLITLSVDETSASTFVRAGIMTVVLIFGWLWI